MARIKVEVCELEFEEGGNTLWIHSPSGATVLRIKTEGKIVVTKCDTSPVTHSDIIVKDDIHICVSGDASK